jgi:D-alanyl-D-alanine carboxypeptidase
VEDGDIGSDANPRLVQVGDVITYEELLFASLLKSDNNAANAMRRPVGYIIKPDATSVIDAKIAFYNAMQSIADTIGMENTVCDSSRISAASGVVSTVEDLCKLVKYVYENVPIVSAIWGQLAHTITVTGSNPRSWEVTSTTTQAGREIIPEFVGGKTGSGDVKYAYAFLWKDSNNNYYATSLLNGILATGNKFDDARKIIDNVYLLT